MTAAVVVIAYFGLWEAPARTPTHELELRGDPVAVAEVAVETHGWWTVCVTGTIPGGDDMDAERVAVVLPSTWTAHVSGVLPRIFLVGVDTEVRDRASGAVLRDQYEATVEGVELGLSNPDEAAVIEAWTDRCGEADGYVAMVPATSLAE
ncbi:hypothetical protein [Demequina mangrovi]|uniref:Uncharacterized protein n=1 Tax=Demequina mangrovi TaxID=1043493 RepID=A0A1H7ADK4_9MICO|nr:hypothetical protein [Demequina mangrovi]SEJ61987.1 hypothetical protein SAMN05421637_2430 [Demequina mangrovi]